MRAALVEAGEHRRRRSVLAEEVARLAADEQDRVARTELMADMDAVASDWPA